MPNRQDTTSAEVINATGFPIRLLTFALVLTVVTLAWFGWIIFDAVRDSKELTSRLSRIEQLRGIIIHLDEVLTMSERMALETGDSRWEKRYRQFDPQLDAAIQETRKLGNTPAAINAATRMDQADGKLKEMENRAFALVRIERQQEAKAVLFSSEYQTQKNIYIEGLTSFVNQIRRELDEAQRKDQRIDLFSIVAAAIVCGLSFLAWLSAVRAIQRWRVALERSISESTQAGQVLRSAHDELEVRVGHRTVELSASNKALHEENIERKRAEEALQESEARMKAIIQSSLDCIVSIDHEGKILEFNPAAETVFGSPRAGVLGLELAEVIIPPALRERHRQGLKRYLATGESKILGQRMEIVAMRSDGSEFPVELAITRNGLQEPPAFTGFIRDITGRKRAEEALQEQARLAVLEADVGTALTQGGTLPEMLRLCSEAIVRNLDAAFARIWTLNEGDMMLELQASAGMYTHLNGPHGRVPVGKFKIGLIAEEQKPHLTNHVAGDPRVGDQEWVKREGMVAFAGYPLLVDDRLVGVVAMFARHTLTDTSLQALASISKNIALGIERKQAAEELRESERRFSDTLRNLELVAIMLDRDARITYCNDYFLRLTGWQREEVIGRDWFELFLPPETIAELHVLHSALLTDARLAWHHENEILTRSGARRLIRWNNSVLRSASGDVIGTASIGEEITESRRAQEILRESEEKFHQLADNITDAFWIRSPDMREVHYISPAFERIWGRPVESLYANPQQWTDSILQEDRESVLGAFAELTGDTPSLDIEYRITRPGGEIRWVRARGFQVRDAAHKLIRLTGIVTDITERKRSERAVKESEARYRSFFEANPIPMWVYDLATLSFLEVNDAAISHYGYAREEFLAMTIADIRPTADKPRLLANVAGTPYHGVDRAGVWKHRKKDGSMIDVEITSHILDFGGRQGELVLALDITERKKAETAAAAFSILSKELSFATVPEEASRMMSEAADELLEWDAFSIQLYSVETDTIHYLFSADMVDGIRIQDTQRPSHKPGEMQRRILDSGAKLILREQPGSFLPGGRPFGNEARPSASLLFVPIRSKTRTFGIVTAQSYAPNAYDEHDLRTLQTLADQGAGALERISANEALHTSEALLFQSQKMETVGKLAGGVAHEFNSILTAIIGHSELILSDLPYGSSLSRNVTEIRKAADRAAILTQQLLAYGRKQILEPETLDLNDIIEGMEAMFHSLLGGDVDVRIILTARLHVVKADAAQIEQVIANMAINARQAMPNGGKLTLETGNVTFDQESVGRYAELAPGDYVMLAITDTGTGMTPEVKARVFEPFFTTKSVGQGTGLGLATCYGIIKQSGGHISVYSEIGRGTTFKIYLPQVNRPVEAHSQPPASTGLPRGTEMILLVEDDPALREMAAELLRRLGYAVLTADNGVNALSVIEQHGGRSIDLLFTDVVMPLLSGKELSDRVLVLYPKTKTLFTSAYTENAVFHQGMLDPGVALLQKPFTPSALALKLREVLDHTS